MKQKHRFGTHRLVTLILLVALLLSSCGEWGIGMGTPGSPSDGEAVTISFAAWDHERHLFEPLAEKFMQEHPDITVVLVPMEDLVRRGEGGMDSPTATLRQVVSGADTAISWGISPEALRSDLLLDLTPLMEADPSFDRNDFYPAALQQYTTSEGLWGLPRRVQVRVLSYNAELFQAAGLPAPAAGWGWNDLLGAAEQIATKRGQTVETYGFFDLSGGIFTFLALCEQQGIDLLSTPAREMQLDRDEIVTIVRRILDLKESGALFHAEPGPPAEREVDPQQLIRDGRIGVWDHEFAMHAFTPEGEGESASFAFDVGNVPYPSLSTNIMGFGSGEGYIISSGTRHPEAAWSWIEFLSRQQIDPQMGTMTTGLFPARRSVAEEVGYWDNFSEAEAAAYQQALEQQTPMPARTPDTVGLNVLVEALMPLLRGDEEDVEKALSDAQIQLEERVAEVQMTPTPEPETGPVVVATPEPQEAPQGAASISFFSMSTSPTELRQVSRAFREEHPDIFVEIASTRMMTGPAELSQLARSYDCFTSSGPTLEEDASSYLLDLQPLFDADATFAQDDYPPALLERYRRNGQLVGLPQGFMMRTLNYNRTAFDAAGIMPPDAEWTVDDFLGAALALTTGEGDTKQYGYVPVGVPIQDLVFFVRQFGGRLTIGSGEQAQPNYSDPNVVAAIRWYLDLAEVHRVMPPIFLPYQRDSQYNGESSGLIQEGRAGMWFDYGHGMFGTPQSMPEGEGPARDFDVGIAPLPIGSGGLSGDDLGYSESLHISAQSSQPQACWEWLKHLSGSVSLLRWTVPARMSVAQSEAFLAQAQPGAAELAQVYRETLAAAGSSVGNLETTEMSDMSYWLFEAINLAIDGEAELDAALVEAQNTASAFQDCVANGGERADCAQQVDPDYDGYLLDMGGAVEPSMKPVP